MMKLTLSVPLIWMLFSTAEALKCVQDSHKLNDESNIVPQPCDSSDDQCLTVAVQHFRNNQLSENITRRRCAPSSVCSEGNQPFSISYDEFRITSSLQCCSTDGCNSKDIPYPDEQKPNGLTCLTHYPWVKTDPVTVQCVGIQDRCISVNETGGLDSEFQGCASVNLCERHTELKLKALLLRKVQDWAGTAFSAPKCCGTSLCDSAPAAKLSVPSLLLGLVVLSVY